MTIKAMLREYGALVRSGRATADDKAQLARAQNALNYLSQRRQRSQPSISGWWDLPVAASMWAADGADTER